MPMDNVTLENTQQSISSRDAKSVASVMVNGKWVNLSDTLEQANVKSDVGTVSKQVAEQQTVITSAVAQADSAVAYANDAIEKSRVNSQAIVDINSAVSDAVSDAAVARSDGLRAWDAAQSNVDLIDSNYASASAAISSARTEAIAAADEAKASASAAQADIVAVRSDVAAVQADVTANKSDIVAIRADVAANKSDAAVVRAGMASDVATVRADVASNKSDISAMRADVASDIAAVRADANALTSQLDGITSNGGGTNILRNTDPTKIDNMESSSTWILGSGGNGQAKVIALPNVFIAKNGFEIYGNTNGNRDFTQRPVPWDNAKYVFSVYAKIADVSDSTSVDMMTRAWSNQVGRAVFENHYTLTSKNWVRVTMNIDASSFYTQSGVSLAFGLSGIGSIDLAEPMLEKGVVAHDWQPAPEDTGADIAAVKSDIAVVRTNLASQATSLSSYAKQASAAGKDITTLKSQAGQFEQDMADTKGDVSQLKVSASSASAALSDAAGNISSLQASAKSYSAALSDTNSNVATVTATASDLETKYADAAGDINQLQTDAKGTTQALADAKGDIAVLQSRADGFDTEFANTSGDISKLQTDAKGTAQTLVDAKDDIAKLKVRADGFDTEFADTNGNISKLQADAKGTTQTLADAQDDIAKLKIRADGFDTQFSNANGDINKLQTDASGTKQTLTNAKSDIAVLQSRADGYDTKFADTAGDISTLQASAKSYSAALSDAKGDIATVKATASELETKYADAAGDINQLQSDAKGTTQTLADAKGDIAKLKTRADGFDTEFANANGDISKLQTDASGTKQTLANAKSDIAVLQSRADGFDAKYADAAGDINTIKVNAKGMQQTLTNAKGDISTLQATATGFKNTLTDAQGNISTLQSDVAGLKKTTSDHAGNIATLQANAKTLTSQMQSAQGDISTLKQTASGFSSQVSGMSGDLNNLKNQTQWAIVTDTVDLNNIKTPCHEFLKGRVTNAPNEAAWWYLTVEGSESNRITQTVIADQSNNRYTRRFAGSWSAWVRDATQTDVTALSNRITTNSTQITQNKKAITLKADQTTVDKANGDVALLKSQLKVQADQINSKVSSSDLPNLVGKGGCNLLAGSLPTDSNNLNGWSIYDGRVGTHTFLDDGATNMFILSNTTTKENFIWSPFVSLEKGETYTLSYYAFATSNTVDSGEVYAITGNYAEVQSIAGPKKLSAHQAVRYVYTFPFHLPSGKYHLRFDNNGSTNGQRADMYIGKPMLEKGTIAHEWQPAPEDAQTYTQTQIKQTADSWNANLTSVKDGLTDKYTNLHATVDGIQAQVYNKDGSSRITQLSNLIATKVSSGDYNSQITQLKNDINLRVAKGNVVSQINQEAGGNTLIQVSNGQGKLALNASSVIFSGSAFIPDAYITTLNADKLRFYDSFGNVATMSAGLEQYDDDKSNKTIVLQYSGGYEVHASDLLGSILTMHDNTIRLAVKANGMASSGNVDQYSGFYATQHYAQLSCYRSNGSAPGIYITDDGYTIKGDESGNGTKWGDLNITSPQIYVTGGNSVSLSGSNAVQMQVNKTHAWLSDGMLHLYKDGDSSSTATELRVEGWAWVNGWVEAAGHSQHSALSTKTDIQSVDDDKMLEMVNDTDLTTFLYKTDVANGETHRHIGLIIDDVHDVAQYQTPQEFIAPNGVSRDDDNMIGALFGAVKALTKRIKTLENKVG